MAHHRKLVTRTLVVISGVIAATLTAIAPSPQVRAETTGGRGTLQPLPGQSYTTTFSGPNVQTVGDLKIDEPHGRVFVSFPLDNTVYVLNLDGSPFGSVVLAYPEAMTLSPSGLYVVARDIGSIIRIDPVTLATTTVASGLIQPRALSWNAGFLYTVTVTGSAWWDRALIRIDPATGTKTVVTTPFTVASQLEHMVDPTPQVGFLFGTYGPGISPNGMNRFDPVTQTFQHNHESFGCEAVADNGELLLGLSDQLIAYDASRLEESIARWTPGQNQYIRACSTSVGSVVLATSSYTTISSVIVYSQEEPGRFIRGYSILNVTPLSGFTKMSKSGATIVVGASSGTSTKFYFLPGVAPGSVTAPSPSAPPHVRSVASPVAPPVTGPGQGSRPTAPPIGTTLPGVDLRAATDWVVDDTHGKVFVVNTAGGLINIYGSDGTAIASMQNLAQPTGLTVCDGQVYKTQHVVDDLPIRNNFQGSRNGPKWAWLHKSQYRR